MLIIIVISRCWPLLPTSWRRGRTNSALLWWGGQMESNWPLAPQKSRVILFTSDTHQSWLHPQVRIGDTHRTSKILGVTLYTPLHLRPSRSRLCRAGIEGSQHHESHCWLELGFHVRKPDGHLQSHRAPHPQLWRSNLVHSSVLNPPGQTWGAAPEQGSKDHNRLPPKGRGVPPQNRDWGPPPRVHLELCSHQFYASSLQPLHPSYLNYRHLPSRDSRPPPSQGHPPGFIPSCLERPANERWHFIFSHLWWRAGGGALTPWPDAFYEAGW